MKLRLEFLQVRTNGLKFFIIQDDLDLMIHKDALTYTT